MQAGLKDEHELKNYVKQFISGKSAFLHGSYIAIAMDNPVSAVA